jgi:NTE family protein
VAGVRRWLEYRSVRSHHHLYSGQIKDYERLARFLLGQSTGFFASAPGVYGATSLGVFKAVQAAGFELDCFAGTGAGAVMAACLALGMDPDDVDQLVTEIMIDQHGLRQKGKPVFSLCDQRAFDRLILKHFPDTDLADLPLPFYAASANFSTGSAHIHRTGNLQIVIRANWPFVGLLPPFINEEGQLLGDGSILNPPPVDLMHKINSGPNVMARAAMPPFGKSPIRYRDLPNWQKLARHPLPWRRNTRGSGLPSFENFLVMAAQGNGVPEEGWLGPLDMLLAAPIPPHLDVLAWQDHSRLKDLSYRWALSELEKRADAGDLPLIAAVPETEREDAS